MPFSLHGTADQRKMVCPAERASVGYRYESDDEAYEIWEKEVGIPRDVLFASAITKVRHTHLTTSGNG